jgi:hypothetical protein
LTTTGLTFWRKRVSSGDELSALFQEHIINLQTMLFERDLSQEREDYTLGEYIAELMAVESRRQRENGGHTS